MSGLILLLGFVLTVMLLPRLLRWWFARRVERYRKSMDDYLRQATGQYGDYADRARADSRSGNIDEEIIVEDADFETLPGIGGWFASRMVEYRSRLGGYSYKEQLMDIRNFDREKYEGLEDLVTVDPAFVRP